MAIIYVRSTTGSNANNGSTWALAKATLAGAAAIALAGDTVYVSQAHAETTAATVTLGFAGTLLAPTKIICANDGAEPPTAVATSATAAVTGVSQSWIINGQVYVYGITFMCGGPSGGSNGSIGLGATNNTQRYESCQFKLLGVSSAVIYPITAAGAVITWLNCNIQFNNIGQSIGPQAAGVFNWTGGSVIAGGVTPTTLIDTSAATTGCVKCLIEDVDFSLFGTGFVLGYPPGSRFNSMIFRNCKLPNSWVGTLTSAVFSNQGRVEAYNTDFTGTNYYGWVDDYFGSIRTETVIVRTGGASDGVTPLSWKLVSSTVAVYPLGALRTTEFVVYNTTTGSAKTLTVEFVRDSLTNLTNKEIWLEVSYFSSSGAPLGTYINNAAANVVVAAADQAASTAAWTTTGMTNPNKQKLSVVITPLLKGYFLCAVVVAKASTTVYVDPKITVS